MPVAIIDRRFAGVVILGIGTSERAGLNLTSQLGCSCRSAEAVCGGAGGVDEFLTDVLVRSYLISRAMRTRDCLCTSVRFYRIPRTPEIATCETLV